ncbi:MAG: esterase family protein [Cyclobacteriaceae bacterium]|nr:esterase family protein [Cyclobacteriaceae bacterium HetDA_MAG_MS6]
MKKLLTVLILFVSLQVWGQSAILSYTIDTYDLDVYLPPSYNANRCYPIVYANDGESLFGFASWRVEELLDSLIGKKIIEPIVMVGIYEKGKRNNYYIPYEDAFVAKGWGSYLPEAENYTRDVVEVIKPFIEGMYPTCNEDRAIMGASFGGLQSSWAGLKYPDVFSMSIAFSPSYWVKDYAFFKEKIPDRKTSFWFDIGTAEWNILTPFLENLVDAGYEIGQNCFYLEVPDGQHHYLDWKERMAYPLIAFTKTNGFEPKSMKVELEYIESQKDPGSYFKRINPVITLKNKMKFSACLAADFHIRNTADSLVSASGQFIFGDMRKLEVEVAYQNLKKKVVISKSKLPYN